MVVITVGLIVTDGEYHGAKGTVTEEVVCKVLKKE